MKILSLCAAILGLALLLPFTTVYSDEVSDAELVRLLKLRVPNTDIGPPSSTPLEGVYQTRFGNRYGYLLEGGRYIIIGDMVDLQDARNLTEASRRDDVVRELANFSADQLVVYPARNQELAVLNVFTDTSCGYCQQLHSEVEYLQDAGISVRYFPYPRGGSRGPGYADLKKVWCADDKLEAMSIAKRTMQGSLEAKTCSESDIVDQGYALGNRIGVTGTPALFSENGTKFNGYVPHAKLIPQLLAQ